MSFASALPLALRSLTSAKITQLSKQRDAFEARRAAIYKEVDGQSGPRERVEVLLDGLARLMGGVADKRGDEEEDEDGSEGEEEQTFDDDDDYDYANASPILTQNKTYCWNIRRFLRQSRYDSSVHVHMVCAWEHDLRRMVDLLSVKHAHAVFFSRLVTEWLGDPDAFGSSTEKKEDGGDAVASPSSASSSSFEKVGREEMYEQREAWEKLVFEPRLTDTAKIEEYLQRLFAGSKNGQKALKGLRGEVGYFAKLFTDGFSPQTLKWVIPGVIGKDLLSAEKVEIPKDLLANDLVALEVSDVLNMRLRQLESWTWTGDAVALDMKRHLNGKYRVYMDEDVLDALFVHFIGVKWAVQFKTLFKEHLKSAWTWTDSTKGMDQTASERRRYFLRESEDTDEHARLSIATSRRDEFVRDFFMCQLPDRETENTLAYDDDEQGDGEQGARKDFVMLKHRLHHLAIADSRIVTALRGEFTIVQSDFAWFGASLSHTTLLAVLKFFGVPEVWLAFFKRFLEAPLRFASDGPDGPIRVRKNGVPLSHSISDWMGETLLFCMDYAVNQYADGTLLYRLHDDFWFWGEEEACVKAWKAVKDFTAVTGLEVNESKSGTAQISNGNDTLRVGDSIIPIYRTKRDESSRDVLPAGDIKSGFLRLNQDEGRFEVDQEQIDAHIKELKVQLDACKSVFSWVRAWNAYLTRFFSNNFGTPATCFGRQHIDMIIGTLTRVEKEIFAEPGSKSDPINVTEYLRRMIAKRFDVHDLPDGFFYFPAELGGLELRNPFIPFLSMRENVHTSPERILRDALAQEERSYLAAKKQFEKNGPLIRDKDIAYRIDSRDTFMSLEEYMYRAESRSSNFNSAYTSLLQQPQEISVSRTPAVGSAQAKLPTLRPPHRTPAISNRWRDMTPYWKWVVELYHWGMLERFGGLAAVESDAVPLGVVRVFKEGKMRWHG